MRISVLYICVEVSVWSIYGIYVKSNIQDGVILNDCSPSTEPLNVHTCKCSYKQKVSLSSFDSLLTFLLWLTIRLLSIFELLFVVPYDCPIFTFNFYVCNLYNRML